MLNFLTESSSYCKPPRISELEILKLEYPLEEVDCKEKPKHEASIPIKIYILEL